MSDHDQPALPDVTYQPSKRSLAELTGSLPPIGNKRFLELNAEEREVHVRKAAGYSGKDNPDAWANFREAHAWGLTPAQGCAVRLGDKYRRVQNLLRDPSNDMVGETIHDTLMDLSNYAKILICLLEEEDAAKSNGAPRPQPIDPMVVECTYPDHQAGVRHVHQPDIRPYVRPLGDRSGQMTGRSID